MRWGILGAAKFARQHMGRAIHAAEGAELVGLATSDPAKAAPFEAFAPGLTVFDSYDALLNDEAIDAVYIPLPNHLHVEWTIRALEAGKHVLCEKPLALSADDFDPVITAATASGKLAAEAFMIVHHPQFQRARALLSDGAIGRLRHVDATFSFNNKQDTTNIRRDPAKGGGALRDIGVYIFGAARFVTGEEPRAIRSARIDTRDGVDDFVQVAADFPDFSYSGMVGMSLFPRQEVVFHGEDGVIRLTCPFNANVFDVASLTLENNGLNRTTERWPAVNHYVLQVEAFERAAAGQEDYPVSLEFSKGTQEMMDKVYAAGGFNPGGGE